MSSYVAAFPHHFRRIWLAMIELPWKDKGPESSFQHWGIWIGGWAWVAVGIVWGAFTAPLIVQRLGLTNTPYQDPLAIGVAVIAGFVFQFVLMGWLATVDATGEALRVPEWGVLARLWYVLAAALPTAVIIVVSPVLQATWPVGYHPWIGPRQSHVAVAFVGGFIVKVLLAPLVKAIGTGWGLKRLMTWLRRNNVRASKP